MSTDPRSPSGPEPTDDGGLDLYRGLFSRLDRPLPSVFWVEIGCRVLGPDGDTFHLHHDFGAHGLLVPLTPAALADCRAQRPREIIVETATRTTGPGARAEAVRNALRKCDRPIDLLVLDRADADSGLLAAIDPKTTRPAVVRLRGTTGTPTWPQALERLGYRLFDHPAGGSVAVDMVALASAGSPRPAAPASPPSPAAAPAPVAEPGPALDPARRVVHTFDVFDTLVARRCLDPWRVFAMVGERTGIPDFVAHRRTAEARVAGAPHTLDDIYAEFGRALALDADVVEAVKAIEIACELEVVVPVAENLARVADGDLLISDMYLPAKTIRDLLARAGLERDAGLVVTSAGKHQGWIWPKIVERFAIAEHLGDNLHSDVNSPAKHGIAARHTTLTRFSPIETLLEERGLRDLALAARETRLATWSDDADLRSLQLIQADLNFPLLFLSAIVVARRAAALGVGRVLFSARDCNLWVKAFAEIAERTGLACEGRYFYTSRLARLRASDDYLAYVADAIGDGAIVADICGTGASLARLMETLDRRGQETFFIHRVRPQSAGVEAPDPRSCVIASMIDPSHGEFDNRYFEMSNYAEHGMVDDVLRLDGGWAPIFAADPRAPAALRAVAEQKRCFARALEAARNYRFDDAFGLDDEAISSVARELYAILVRQKKLFEVFVQSHTEEDRQVMTEARELTRP